MHLISPLPQEPAAIVEAERFVSEAVDNFDRLVGCVIGEIDDESFHADESSVTRIRKHAARVRSNLLAALGQLEAARAVEDQ
jgi:hypothetical protein